MTIMFWHNRLQRCNTFTYRVRQTKEEPGADDDVSLTSSKTKISRIILNITTTVKSGNWKVIGIDAYGHQETIRTESVSEFRDLTGQDYNIDPPTQTWHYGFIFCLNVFNKRK